MNTIIVAGNIGGDAELRQFPSKESVCSFSVADSQGKDTSPIWWRCQIWGKRAEALAPFLKKGGRVTVSGTLREREYTDKNGAPKKAQELRVRDIALQDGPQRGTTPTPAVAASDFDDGAISPPEPPDDVDDDIPPF